MDCMLSQYTLFINFDYKGKLKGNEKRISIDFPTNITAKSIKDFFQFDFFKEHKVESIDIRQTFNTITDLIDKNINQLDIKVKLVQKSIDYIKCTLVCVDKCYLFPNYVINVPLSHKMNCSLKIDFLKEELSKMLPRPIETSSIQIAAIDETYFNYFFTPPKTRVKFIFGDEVETIEVARTDNIEQFKTNVAKYLGYNSCNEVGDLGKQIELSLNSRLSERVNRLIQKSEIIIKLEPEFVKSKIFK